MQQCSNCISDYKAVRYISFISDEGDDENASSNKAGDDESNNMNSAGGEKELGEVATADQIFLETTV